MSGKMCIRDSVKASEEDEQLIKDLQKSAVFRDPTMAAAGLVGAQADAMRAAAANEGAGPFMAFAGMNMAQMAGGGQDVYKRQVISRNNDKFIDRPKKSGKKYRN